MLQNVDFFKTLLNGIKSKFQSQQKQISKHNTRLDDQQAQIEDLKNKKIDAVLYTPQTLTEEQQKQARDNIGADVGGYFEIRVTKSGDTYTADKTYDEIEVAVKSGLEPICRMKVDNGSAGKVDATYSYTGWQITTYESRGNCFMFTNNVYTQLSTISIWWSGIVSVSDNQIQYTLPIATSTTLGGVKPVAKTDAMTQGVGVDKNGKLYTEPAEGGTDLSLDITGAAAGQIAKISAVDENGVPTAWTPADMPSGGGGDGWEKVAEATLTEIVNEIRLNFDPCKAVYIEFQYGAVEDDLGIIGIYPNPQTSIYTGEARAAAVTTQTSDNNKRGWMFCMIDRRKGTQWVATSQAFARSDGSYGSINPGAAINCDIGVRKDNTFTSVIAQYYLKDKTNINALSAYGAGMNIGTTLAVWGIKA